MRHADATMAMLAASSVKIFTLPLRICHGLALRRGARRLRAIPSAIIRGVSYAALRICAPRRYSYYVATLTIYYAAAMKSRE